MLRPRLAASVVGIFALGVVGLLVPLAHLTSDAYANNPDCSPSYSSFVGDGSNGGDAGITYQVVTFDTPGTCDWTVPEGVSSADVLIVGGGGGVPLDRLPGVGTRTLNHYAPGRWSLGRNEDGKTVLRVFLPGDPQ